MRITTRGNRWELCSARAPSIGCSGSSLTLQGYLSYIKGLPLNDMPEIFGLHDNANITFAQNETYALLGAIIQLQPKSSSIGGQGREEVGGSRGKELGVGQGQSPTHCPTCSPVGRDCTYGILQELRAWP